MSSKNIKNNRCKNDFVDIVLLITGAIFCIMTILATVAAGYGLFYQLPSWLPFAKPKAEEFVFGLACSVLALIITSLITMLAFSERR